MRCNRSGSPVVALAGEDNGFPPVDRLLGAFETGLHRAVRLGGPHLFRVSVVASATTAVCQWLMSQTGQM